MSSVVKSVRKSENQAVLERICEENSAKKGDVVSVKMEAV